MRAMLAVPFLALASPDAVRGGVVINEVFYNAPDGLDDVQWIELLNTGDRPVDLGGWTLDRGQLHVFPQGAAIEGQGYLVVALRPERFAEVYGSPAAGPLKRPLKRGGERIALADGRGRQVDSVRFEDRGPWPVSADGYSASIERICPSAPGDLPGNWAASPLPADAPRPSGTPGKENAGFSAVLPPLIEAVSAVPDDPAPREALRVEAEVKDPGALREVSLLYRLVARGVEGDESAVLMSRDAASGRFRAVIPGQEANTLVRYRIRAVNEAGAARLYPGENDLRPTRSVHVHEKLDPGRTPLGLIIQVGAGRPEGGGGASGLRGRGRSRPSFFGRGAPRPPRPPRGSSAFVYRDRKTGKTTVFDHLDVDRRGKGGGHIVRFHKDHTLDGMTVIHLVYEGSDRFLLAEALAHDVYRRAGNAAPLTELVRLWVDGRLAGPHLMIERPNRAFLRRNRLRDDGNLYKLIWFGQGVAGQHERRAGTGGDHQDLLSVIDRLRTSAGDEQWKAIEEHFNVAQVATYFAVNTVLSHWDGFFNNYFAYHDLHGTKKWEMYPWDQDKTWGYHDGIGGDEVFSDMPLTFGMAGDRPPAPARRGGRGIFAGGFGGLFDRGGPAWWRPAGWFSGSLLANSRFRKVFLDRTREVLEKVYTEEVYFPLIDGLADRLGEEVRLRAEAHGIDPESAARQLARDVQSLRTHLIERRRFLLAQEELRSPGR